MSAAKGTRKQLRSKAEKILSAKPTRPPRVSADEARHELQVHQVELELQVEELRRAEAELQSMRDRYLFLYDAAPVGYVTLDRSNLITQANAAAAGLLGVSKTYLRSRRFSAFLGKSWQGTFLEVTAEARRSGADHTMEAQTVGPGGAGAWVKLDIAAELASGELRVTLTDVTERRNAERELRKLAEGLISLQEKERHAIAEALHDDAGQQLTYLTILLDQVQDTHGQDNARFDQVREVTRKVLQQIRELSASLRPADLVRVGLPGALRGMISEFTTRTRIPVAFSSTGAFEALPAETALAVYRIIQEGLTNAARHARPRSIELTMHRDPRGVFVHLHDDGTGFDVAAVPMSVGLLGMRERARAVGGSVRVTSSPGKGTHVVFELRLPAP